jgi:fermentation-respiration switch protein FrsA (DUF1100 family)
MSLKIPLLNVASGFFLFLALAFSVGRIHETNSMLHPSHGRDYSPSEFGLEPEEIFFGSGGQNVHAWYFSGKPENTTLLYIQGNAGTSANRLGAIKGYVDLGLNVFIYEPRGFGQSGGMAIREYFIEDAFSAYNYLVNVRKVDAGSIVIFGQSLGGIPTLRLANSVKCKGVILEGTLVSIRQMANDFYPKAPIWLLASSDFDNAVQVANLKVPVLFIVGANDDIISPYHSKKLHQLAHDPKELLIVEGANHTDMFLVDPALYFGTIAKFTGVGKKTG